MTLLATGPQTFYSLSFWGTVPTSLTVVFSPSLPLIVHVPQELFLTSASLLASLSTLDT